VLQRIIERKARSAKESSKVLYNCPTKTKNKLLEQIGSRLREGAASLLKANERDLRYARAHGLSSVLIDRLTLNAKRIGQMIRGIQDVVALPDPVGETFGRIVRANGLVIEKIRVPIGAVGIIYEARPNVTIDASILCLKAGNAVLLRGGSEALQSNKKLVEIIKSALRDTGLPQGCAEFIDTTDREAVQIMVKQDRYLDLIIPRGGQQLIRFIQEQSTVPVIAHGEGNCHVFVDASADQAKAGEIVFNAKVQRPSVCNAAEKLLVHQGIASSFLPSIAKRFHAAGVQIRGDKKTRSILKQVKPAVEKDWYTEYLDLIIAVKVVRDLDEAIKHINRYGSHHSDSIVTDNQAHGERFLREVDSAAVYVNASTRFTDGFEFGLGAEIGISTQKLHARGPMGLRELTSTKYITRGDGQIRT
jgi:glutamate-5-semialdehyde dehydrogenase